MLLYGLKIEDNRYHLGLTDKPPSSQHCGTYRGCGIFDH